MANKLIEPILPPDTYRDVFDHLIHFSSKLSNTNAQGGVRVGPDYQKNVPYAAVCTAQCHDVAIETDYFRNAASEAKPFKHRRLALEKGGDLSEEQIEAKAHYISLLGLIEQANTKPAAFDLDSLSPRLTQVLLPTGEGGYLAITPLHSAGFAKHLHEQQKAAQLRIHRASRSVGGANPQNAGGLVWFATQALCLSAPQEDRQFKKAVAVLYQGVDYGVPKPAFMSYLAWLQSLAQQQKGVDHNLKTREHNQGLALSLIKPYCQRLIKLRVQLGEQLAELTEPSTTAKTFKDATLNILLGQPLARSERNLMASQLSQQIARYRDKEERQLGWDVDEQRRMSRLFADHLAEQFS